MEVVITYETLYELLRREKNREELQELDPNFFADAIEYMKDKMKILEESENKDDLFSSTERSKTKTEIENIKKILKDLYERRERKIITIAMDQSRTKSNLFDASKMLAEERSVYEALVKVLDAQREGVLQKVLEAKVPEILSKEAAAQPAEKLIRFLKAVPKFVGEELEVYGPFEEDNVANLPSKIADVLISKGRAEPMG